MNDARHSDPLLSISVRDLFMALRWTNGKEFAQALGIEHDSERFRDLFQSAGMAARGLNDFSAEELVALTNAYQQRNK